MIRTWMHLMDKWTEKIAFGVLVGGLKALGSGATFESIAIGVIAGFLLCELMTLPIALYFITKQGKCNHTFFPLRDRRNRLVGRRCPYCLKYESMEAA